MENCWEEAPHGSQDYYPHYNLFQSSIFYDTDNFRVSYLSYRYDDCSPTESGTQCCEEQERSAEPPDKPAEVVTAAAGAPEPYIITKEELYKDPDLFRSRNEDVQAPLESSEPPFLSDSRPWGYDWTKQSWVKPGRGALVVMRQKGERKEVLRNKQKLYKQLANAPRVSVSKAESMMQKMGWQGGALGKTSDGIVEPVTPDPQYAFSTLGFGQRTTPPLPAKPPLKPPPRKHSKRDAFRTNVLLHVLQFVQDDTEIELLFDASLRQHERRSIHSLVHSVIGERDVGALGSAAQYQLVADIASCSQYELATVSDGDPPHRQISIYKEAPEHVYLVTPDDFQPKDPTDEPTPQGSNDNHDKENDSKKMKKADDEAKNDDNDAKGMDMDDDENPFLKSIKKSIKKDEEPKNISNKFEKDCNIAKDDVTVEEVGVEAKMLEFFLEFAESKAYKELRFLGKFTAEQMEVVNSLLNDIAECIEDKGSYKGKKEVLKVFKSGVNFQLKEGLNGTTEIHKVPPPRK
ncbi:uncharacterized protein [Choristoneura fumiferana]|uniref:uncharacterized protein n=1 Tax=Choristoneura fumiferana TaxID=7141 RepID=UPI003D15C769